MVCAVDIGEDLRSLYPFFLGGQPLLDDIYCCIKSAQSTFSLQKKSWKPSYIFQLLTSHLYCPLAHKLLINLSKEKYVFEKKCFIKNIIQWMKNCNTAKVLDAK